MKRHWLALAAFALIASPARAGDPPAATPASPAAAAVNRHGTRGLLARRPSSGPMLRQGSRRAPRSRSCTATPPPGIFAMRIQLPANYKVKPHFHPADENVTVLSGDLYMAMGDSWDESKGHKLVPGAYSMMPKGSHHYAWTKEPTVIQIRDRSLGHHLHQRGG